MKKTMLVCLFAGTTAAALAAAPFAGVPEPLGKSLGMHSVQSATMQGGVLRVQLNKPVLTELTYYTFVYHGICAEQWHSPTAFKQMGLKRVEVLDAAGVQGFAFDGDTSTCAEMGNLGKKFGVFIGERTTRCDAGQCTGGKRN